MAETFRKKVLEQVASPDRLDEYIKVSNPSVWLLLGAICASLIGVGLWCVFGTIVEIGNQPIPASELSDDKLAIVNPQSAWVATATAAIDMPNGDYPVNITVEEYKPFDLLLNRS